MSHKLYNFGVIYIYRLFLLGRGDGKEKDQENHQNYFVWIATKFEILLTLLLMSNSSSETRDSSRRLVS